jgi:diguanylate cyclase (GGDEF)-like protein/PAS domain S-box-containing protein
MKTMLSPTLRIALGLIGLCVSLFILADFVFGIVSDRSQEARHLRARVAESATAQVAELLRTQELPRVVRTLEAVRKHNPDLRSVAIRDGAGSVLALSGAHAHDWADQATNVSTVTRVAVPIMSAQGQWGRAEFEFTPVTPTDLLGWLSDRTLWIALGLPLLALALVYLYLRRALVHLNPMNAVPERLRDAFDGLTEGVALLNARGRVVLANNALRDMVALDANHMHGRPLAQAAQLELASPGAALPWYEVASSGKPVRGVRVYVGAGEGRKIGMMNCSPIVDPQGEVRGCLVTVDDVTAIERSNEELRQTMAQLEQSRAQIEEQNQELVKLATRDSLTGLLNRRAFFDIAHNTLARTHGAGERVAAMMIDVDHFKAFNDRYGHAMGDMVLQRVGKQLLSTLRAKDVVARYGGEEFCALVEVADEAAASELAERVRRAIQIHAGTGIRHGVGLTVTVSVGVALSSATDRDLGDLLKRADKSLYEAKHQGRNRVVLHGTAAPAAPSEALMIS